MRLFICLTSVLYVGCFSLDDFSYQAIDDPNAPIPCVTNADCPPMNGAVQICENRFCRTPIQLPSAPATQGSLSEPNVIPEGGGTYYVGDITVSPNSDGTFIIEADDIIIEGTVRANSSRSTTIGFLARRALWVRNSASFSTTGSAQARFVLQSHGKIYIDDGAQINDEGTCVCYRADDGDEASNTEVVTTGQGCDTNFQCYRIDNE